VAPQNSKGSAVLFGASYFDVQLRLYVGFFDDSVKDMQRRFILQSLVYDPFLRRSFFE